MAETMRNGPYKGVLSEAMEQPWKSPESPSRLGDSISVTISSPKAPLRSLSYGNFKSIGGAGSAAPPPKRATSVVEEMETKQRENMTRKLKGLQLSGGRSPQMRNKVEMPTIVDSRLAKTAALSRSTLRRDSVANYQAVTPAAAFNLKGGGASQGTPSPGLRAPELFPLRASRSLTSLNRIYDGGLSVYASDDFDNYSVENGIKEDAKDTGSVMLRPSLSSSIDTALVREIRPAEEKAVENAIGNIFRDSKAVSLTTDVKPTPDKLNSKQDVSLTSGISPTAGPKLNLKTYPKPQIPSKPADLKAFTSKEEKTKTWSVGNAEESDSRAVSRFSVPVSVAASPPRNSHQILSDFNHSRGSIGGVTRNNSPKTVSQLLEIQKKTDHLTKSHSNTADPYRQSPEVGNADARSVSRSPKPSLNLRSHADVNGRDLLIPSTPDVEASSDFAPRVSTRTGVLSGSRTALQSNSIPGFVSHQKMDSLLSDCNTVDSGIGRSAGSPGSLYQDSVDELDSKGYAGWTAPAKDRLIEGGRDTQQQKPKMQTKKEFVSTAEISLSPPVMETSKVNSIEIKPTIKDMGVSTRRGYYQETNSSASSLRGTTREPSDLFQGTQNLTSVQSRSSQSSYTPSTNPNQPTSGFINLDSKVTVEAETSRPIRVSGKKHPREDVASVLNSDVHSGQGRFSEHSKTTTSNLETNFSESPYTSGSRYTRYRESEVSEVKSSGEGQQSRDLYENGTRFGDEPQRSRIKSSTLFGDTEGRKESRTEVVTQSYALNKNSQDNKSIQDPHRTGPRTYVRETSEVRNENKLFHEPRRTGESRTDVRPTPEVKEYVSRDPLLTERTQYRHWPTPLANSPGYEPRRQSMGTKKEEEMTTRVGDDGMIEMEVQLIKGLTGLGFCIEGGIDSPMGDIPITVKRLFKGESAAKGKLQPGDVILAINGKPMSNRSHYQAWNHLKSLPEGPINLAIRRRGPLPPATLV